VTRSTVSTHCWVKLSVFPVTLLVSVDDPVVCDV
jgi:hypothetical protein